MIVKSFSNIHYLDCKWDVKVTFETDTFGINAIFPI